MEIVAELIRNATFLTRDGCLPEARKQLEEVLTLAPGHLEALTQLANIYSELGEHTDAISCLNTILNAIPGQMESLFGLGVESFHAGRYTESVDVFENLISIQPLLPVLHRWRAAALAELGQDTLAYLAFQEALRLLPDYSLGLTGLACLLVKNKRLEEAETHLKRAIELEPDNGAAHTEIARVYRLQGRMAEAKHHYYRAFELSPESRQAADNYLFIMCYPDTLLPEETAQEHINIMTKLFPCHERVLPAPIPARGKAPLRIGYLSGDFYTHAVAFFLEPVLTHHDRKKISVYCYSNSKTHDETTARLKALDIHWRDILGLSAEKVARQIEADGIDILVELSGHTAGNHLDVCALRPAPLQLTWLGYPHSTGMTQIDYYLSDQQCDPVGMTEHLYSEHLWRLPRIFCCYIPPIEFPPVSPAPFLSNGIVTFGSFNNFAKVTDTIINLWAEILGNVAGSQLLLKSIATEGEATQDSIRARFTARGIAPDRIITAPFAANSLQHLAQYARIDIALDTYPYHGTTTTCEALWMGVPVVSLAGRTHLSRVGVSLLSNVGLEELVADSPERYVKTAVTLARNPQRLILLRDELRHMMATSPLMDAEGITRDVEEAFAVMYAARQAGYGDTMETNGSNKIGSLVDFLDRISRQVYAEKPSDLHSYITIKSVDTLLEICPLRPGARILDVGCGQGPALEYFSQKGFFPVGVTMSDEDVQVCRNKGFTTARMDQSFLEFDSGTFDLVWARHVVEHSIFPLFTLDGFQRVIRDDGYLYLEVPAPDTSCHHEQNPNHYSVLTKSSWLSLLQRTGFEVVHTLSYTFDVVAGPDEYWAFYCRKKRAVS